MENVKKIMLLVAPCKYSPVYSTNHPPLGILYIAAVLENNGYEVMVMDAPTHKLDYEDILKKIEDFKPCVVGITCTTETRHELLETTIKIKEHFPETFIIVGGQHVSHIPEETLNATAADMVIVGEGEETFLEVVREHEFPKIDGIAYRSNGKVVKTKPRVLIHSLDELPFPARHLLDMNMYGRTYSYIESERTFHIVTQRGCPFGCNYCASTEFWLRSTRSTSPQRVIEEMKFLIDKYNVKAFYFYDDAFTVNKKRVERFCELLIAEDLDVHWGTDTRIDLVNKRLLELMGRSGCVRIDYGLETLNPKAWKYAKKKADFEKTNEIINDTLNAGIRQVALNILIGLPGDSFEGFRDTARKLFSTEVGDKCMINILRIYPGTKVEAKAKEKGILPKNFSWYAPYSDGFTRDPTVPLYTEQPKEELQKQHTLFEIGAEIIPYFRKRIFKNTKGVRRTIIESVFFNLMWKKHINYRFINLIYKVFKFILLKRS